MAGEFGISWKGVNMLENVSPVLVTQVGTVRCDKCGEVCDYMLYETGHVLATLPARLIGAEIKWLCRCGE